MEFIDAHTHLTALTWKSLEDMYLAGIRTIVSPITFVTVRAIDSNTMKNIWDHQIEYQLKRTNLNLIKAYSMIGVFSGCLPNDPDNLLKILPNYLKKLEVVAIGEIGFEPNSRTCKDLKLQEEVVRSQLELAKKFNLPVVFHTPNLPEEKKKFTKKLIKICNELNMDMSKIVFDHTSEVNIEEIFESGAMAAITVQPWRFLFPETAADLVLRYSSSSERILINSDCGMRNSDPIAVAKTAYMLKKRDASDELIRKVCFYNSKEIYNI